MPRDGDRSGWAQVELLPQLLKMMDVKTMTGSEGQRKLTLGNATILAYCLRWAGFRVCAPTALYPEDESRTVCAPTYMVA